MTKLQIGMAGALLTVGAASFVVEAQHNATLRSEIADLRRQNQATPLNPAISEVASGINGVVETGAERPRKDELTAMREQADTLRARLRAAGPSGGNPIAADQKPPFTGIFYEPSQVDLQPKAVFKAGPRVPPEWSKAGTNDQALIDFIVDDEGVVRNATVASATMPAIGEAALEAVRRWRFAPGQKSGATVATHLQAPFTFSRTSPAENAKQPSKPSVQWF